MGTDIEIVPLSRRTKDVERFLKVSCGIYQDNPHWVAPLWVELKRVFSEANPLFEHAQMQLWAASREGNDVGRIAGILDHHHNRVQNDHAAFFGFFECVHDSRVSQGLFDAAFAWARAQGVRRMMGPMNPTTNDECGLLVEGFDSPPVFMMTYNPRYYADLLGAAGFRKAKNLWAFQIDLAHCPMERLERIARQVKERHPELKFRLVRRQTLDSDLAKIKEVYNEAWRANWSFVPMTDAEIQFLAGRLKPLLIEGLVWLAETPTEPAGFLLALPDFNEALQPLRGRLLTPRVLGFLPYLLGWKRPIRARVVALGVKEKFRGRGLESVMLLEGLKAGWHAGFREAEASWVLEDNVKMHRVLEVFGAKPYKTYRLYERDV